MSIFLHKKDSQESTLSIQKVHCHNCHRIRHIMIKIVIDNRRNPQQKLDISAELANVVAPYNDSIMIIDISQVWQVQPKKKHSCILSDE